jgi:phosphoethanolamine N-methyltransferase
VTAETEPNDLDAGQYTSDSIRKYEAVYGRDFVSPGGGTTALAILSLVDITPGMRVLDVGCGLGGAAFLMARRFGARVHGIDLSRNMLQFARSRCRQADLTQAVTFEHADIVQYDPRATYDLVHSRDVFLHIHEKGRLFGALMRCLRPGGHVLFSDYLCCEGAPSRDFAAYIGARNYDLCSLAAYRAQLARAGFAVVLAEDRTAEFIGILERELDQLHASALPAHERDELAQSWQAKLRRAHAGEQRWGVFLGRKNEE